MNPIEVRSIKITIPIQADSLPTDCIPPDGKPVVPVPISFKCGDIIMTATLNGKSYKKAMKGVVPGAMAVIQGKLGPGNEILECGMAIQPPKPPTETP